jgi:hypothetical protein
MLFMKSLRLFLSLVLLSSLVRPSFAQSAYIPLNQDIYHLMERYEIKSGTFYDKFHAHIKPYQRKIVAHLADSVWADIEDLSLADEFNLDYLKNDSWEWSSTADSDSQKPILKAIYRKKSDFYHVDIKDFNLHINPVLHGFVGFDKDNDDTPYLNTRGVELRGMIARKIGFYTYLTDTQGTMPLYVTQFINQWSAVPNEGYYKRDLGGNGLDFLTARGYISFDILRDKINFQFGYDKNILGSGYRSLILSDFSSNYLFMKINTNIWKINYQNIFAELTAENPLADGLYPQKFMALHHLSVNITPQLNVGLFESIIFSRKDSLSNIYFDFRYLNPLIFYRSIEQQAGSPDNANLGLDFKWNFLKRFSLYGQFFLDEFVLNEIRKNRGWRGNKQAFQIGAKYIDVAGVSNLDLQAEFNFVRPYTYSHNLRWGEYSNYNQPLAHPLGSNFYEMIGVLRYQPIPRLSLSGKAIYGVSGADFGERNYGGNIFKNNTENIEEFGNKVAQGNRTKLYFLDFTASWQIRHNIFVDFKQILRQVSSDLSPKVNQAFTSIAFRWNIPQRFYEF